ncbi:MAG: DMT family transporter [Burkholderiaceae bacterium]|nr:DMT family transporter [Burkholderiaceae bacterium]
MLLALVGVMIFAGTLPATRIAVAELDPTWLALARAELAAVLGAFALWASGARRPLRRHIAPLALTSLGVVVGFPLFSSIAMRDASASHGAVVVGLLPFATVVAAAVFGGERPSRAFWIAAFAGSLIVVVFALHAGGGEFRPSDWSLVAAVVAAAVGYAVGGRLARELGGWQTIAWALLLAAPLLIVPALWLTHLEPMAGVSLRAWAGFAYVTVFSQLIGFLFWYGGMAIGGVARVSQTQLLQLFFTLIFAWLLLGEPVRASTWFAGSAVVALIAIGRRAGVRAGVQPAPPAAGS